MSKSSRQKLKLLYLMQLLLKKTDESHPLSMKKIIAGLEENGIFAERKSLYDDMDCLRMYGLDIQFTKADSGGYFIGNRDFEIPELKLLVDSVQASQFITEKKTFQLIKKLENLCSMYEAQLMQRQVYVSGRIKHMNESIYYSVDAIHGGIATNRKISFRYFEYAVDKTKNYRHNGERYTVSPFALTWDNENYYLIGYDGNVKEIRHYRVDRMENIVVTKEDREGQESFQQKDMSVYTRRNFSMYGGSDILVTMEFEDPLVGVVMDRFGKDISVIKSGENYFYVTASVAVSPQFYAWMFGLGNRARILAPKEVRLGMTDMLDAVKNYYEE
ncbi:MAG: WYL domain-containing protein [Christensenella sp.]|nr:WYL domain-containing protein [Christensenella sp.]